MRGRIKDKRMLITTTSQMPYDLTDEVLATQRRCYETTAAGIITPLINTCKP
jgi:hypothetical protein